MKSIIYYYKRGCVWWKSVLNNKNDFNVPFLVRLKYSLLGFSANEYVWFDLKHNDYRDYISDFERKKSREINGAYKIILDNKTLFEEIFKYKVRVPKNYAFIQNGKIIPREGYSINPDNWIDFIKSIHKCVIKSENGYEGKGIFVLKYNEGCFYINNNLSTSEQIINIVQSLGNADLTEYVEQSEFANKLYPDSSNTMRIICAKLNGTNNAEIIGAIQRIGTKMSSPVDNVSAGGLAAEIDLESGILHRAYIPKSINRDNDLRSYSHHPETGNQIVGLSIPNWNKVKNEIINLTNAYPYLNFVGWDVLLTNDGICIIEGNSSSGLTMFQMEHGVRKGKIGDIYRSYGIIRK